MSAARSPFDLAGRTAPATGGNQGLGRAFAIGPAEAGDCQRYWIDDAPQQRYAPPEAIARSVVFVASDAALFITGSVLVADEGYTAW